LAPAYAGGTPKTYYARFHPLIMKRCVTSMSSAEPSIPIAEIAGLPAPRSRKLERAGIADLAQLFFSKDQLRDAVELASTTGLSIRESLEVRQQGRQHLSSVLNSITAKRKTNPLDLLCKVHWLIALIPPSETRQQTLNQEKAAVSTVLSVLEPASASVVDRILVLALHRTLDASGTTLKTEVAELVSLAEKFQRVSLLAYQIAKAKPMLLANADAENANQRIVALRKAVPLWNQLHQALEQRGNAEGQNVVAARRAADSLAILDLSEQHLKDHVQLTMTTQKLRSSQLTHITTLMNAAVELHDANLVTDFAERGSRIWFELAQGKADRAFTDDLLRSVRFARTAVFHARALDDVKRAVDLLRHLVHLLGEFPKGAPEPLTEATAGVLKTLISTLPLLDRPVDVNLILEAADRVRRSVDTVTGQLRDEQERGQLTRLHVDFQRLAVRQLQQLGAEATAVRNGLRALIRGLLTEADARTADDPKVILDEAAERANDLLALAKPKEQSDEEDLELTSSLISRLAQQPPDSLNDAAKQLIAESNLLNEQLLAHTREPKMRAQLALRILSSRMSLNSAGVLASVPKLNELDELEGYASTALIEHAKAKRGLETLKAGAMLVAILFLRAQASDQEKEKQRFRDAARDFAEKTFTFMPAPQELPEEGIQYALLLFRSIRDFVHGERRGDVSRWEALLTQAEALASALATTAAKRKDTDSQLLALSSAATATAELAALKPPGPKRTQLLTRASTQIQRALDVTSAGARPGSVKAAMDQYYCVVSDRLMMTPDLRSQVALLQEWSKLSERAANLLEKAEAIEASDELRAQGVLNAQLPLALAQCSLGELTFETTKRQLAGLLQDITKKGNKSQAELASQLARRWAYQLAAGTIIDSGYRLETTELGFTLADEKFAISLQVEEQVVVSKRPLPHGSARHYLRPSDRTDLPIWYDPAPILYTTYGGAGELVSWHGLEKATKEGVTIGLWLISGETIRVELVVTISNVEALSTEATGLSLTVAGGEMHVSPPTRYERGENRTVLSYDLELSPGRPQYLPLELRMK
jgi:hypothetical protein